MESRVDTPRVTGDLTETLERHEFEPSPDFTSGGFFLCMRCGQPREATVHQVVSEPAKAGCRKCREVDVHALWCYWNLSIDKSTHTPVLDTQRATEKDFGHMAQATADSIRRAQAAAQYANPCPYCRHDQGVNNASHCLGCTRNLPLASGAGYNCPTHGGRYETYCTICAAAPPPSTGSVGEPHEYVPNSVQPYMDCGVQISHSPIRFCGQHRGAQVHQIAGAREQLPPDQHVAPPKLTVPIAANNGTEVVISGSLLVIRQPNFQQDAMVAVLAHAQAADIVKSLVAAHDIELLAADPIRKAAAKCENIGQPNTNVVVIDRADWESLIALIKGE